MSEAQRWSRAPFPLCLSTFLDQLIDGGQRYLSCCSSGKVTDELVDWVVCFNEQIVIVPHFPLNVKSAIHVETPVPGADGNPCPYCHPCRTRSAYHSRL